MKEIINVELKTRKVEFSTCKTGLLVVGHFSDAKELDRLNKELDSKLDGSISRLIKLGDFKGKEKSSAIVYSNGWIGAERVLLVGLGEKKKATLDTLRQAAANAANKAVSMKVGRLSARMAYLAVMKFRPTHAAPTRAMSRPLRREACSWPAVGAVCASIKA